MHLHSLERKTFSQEEKKRRHWGRNLFRGRIFFFFLFFFYWQAVHNTFGVPLSAPLWRRFHTFIYVNIDSYSNTCHMIIQHKHKNATMATHPSQKSQVRRWYCELLCCEFQAYSHMDICCDWISSTSVWVYPSVSACFALYSFISTHNIVVYIAFCSLQANITLDKAGCSDKTWIHSFMLVTFSRDNR